MILITFSLVVLAMLSSFVVRIAISPPVDPTLDGPGRESNKIIQINVLNANGVRGIAAQAKLFLRSRGFDVVEIGNHKKILEKSIIYDRVGDMKSADKVAYALGIKDSMIYSRVDSNLFLRCTVVIVKDFNNLKPFK